MIAKAPAKGKYGKDTYGLLRYLFGPGKSNEHTDPHLVAAWDPEWLEGGAFAEHHRGWLARLAREIDAPRTGHEVDLEGGHVYHLVLSIPSQDGALGDARWRELVEEAVDRMGFGPTDDGRAGCRWVAVHHGPSKDGNDHVHVAINLVRGDGTIADTYRNWPRWRQWCLEVEQRLDLTRTSPANQTAPIRSTRAEVEKATRYRRADTNRDLLRTKVRTAAVEASSAREFIALLERDLQVAVQPRWGSDRQLTAYRVALRAEWEKASADGRIWFSGSSLAHDLSAPKLTARWTSTRQPAQEQAEVRRAPEELLTRATQAVDNARRHLTGRVIAGDVSDGSGGDDVAHATADMLVAVARALGGPEPGALAEVVVVYERAATAPRRGQPVWQTEVAAALRTTARDLFRAGILSKRNSTGLLAAALVLALIALLVQIAAWRQLSRQQAQATAATRAAARMNNYSAYLAKRHPPTGRPEPLSFQPEPVHKPSSLSPPLARRPQHPQPDPTIRRTR
ncbi:hypothetical protein IOD16_27125 [Saccharothrix sp. 6-C]|uniref:relaxase/mobilization nuclease domain-containing protein n=1 Tax=Saccharothrix sp. 6-C TaxID=2781735 RepID=UPI001916CD61|nr:relaxase/mobilization nuclease domain-containing protein [Saccharothrix sp. 6-C]QQQ74788.1 hypothetical protein IOD16_27125 [Saccharothrix sp. 6-C]